MLTSTTPRRTMTVLTVLSAAALSLSLTACSTANTTTESGPGSSSANIDDWNASWNSCLREQGIEVSAEGAVMTGENQTEAEVADAFNACNEQVGMAPGYEGGDDPQKVHESNQILVDCLQEKGYDIADVKEGENPALPGDIDQADAEECLAASMEVFE